MKEALEKLSKIQELLDEAIKLSGELEPLLQEESILISEILEEDFYVMSQDGSTMIKFENQSLFAEQLASRSISLGESEIGSLLEQELLFLKKEVQRNLDLF